MRIKHTTGAAGSLAHQGVVYQPDEAGFFDVPFSLAIGLIGTPYWESEAPLPVVPEAAPAAEAQPVTPAAEPAAEPEKPATRAAAKAAAKAEETAEPAS